MRRFKRAWFIGLVCVLLDPTWPLSHTAPSAPVDEDAAYALTARLERHAARRSGARARQRARRRTARRAAVARRLARLEASVRRASQVAIQRDDLRGEDPEVRQAVLAALRPHAGTVVVMDPHSGRVYSIVNQEWALRKGFKPCSTIKLLVGLAGLKEGIIDAKAPLPLGGGSIAMNLIEALAHSNNQYFEIFGERLGRATLLRYAREWGRGQPTGINENGPNWRANGCSDQGPERHVTEGATARVLSRASASPWAAVSVRSASSLASPASGITLHLAG